MSGAALIVYTTVADARTALDLADRLVEGRLAACVQVVPGLRSTYRWQGETRHEDELQLVIKTTDARFDALAAWLREHHPYDVPEIVAVPVVRGSNDYLRWIEGETR
jgi:periplasmic divalent cation tolerance protein